ARDVEADAAPEEMRLRAGPRDGRPHGVLIVLDHVDNRQLPQASHVEALVDLALVRRAVSKIRDADLAVLRITVRESDAGAEWNLRTDNAVAAIEILLAAEHMHRAALAFGIAGGATGQFGHHAIGIHAARQHMPVIAVTGDDLIALLLGG